MKFWASKHSHEKSQFSAILLDLVDNIGAMVACWDENQVCVFANDAYRDWFGLSRDELTGKTLEQLLGPTLYAMNLPYIQAAYRGEKQVFEREIHTPDGKVRHSLATYIPRMIDGEVHGIFVHVADVTPLKVLEGELRVAKAEAERMATHDFLTGLPNRVLLMDRISQALAVSVRNHKMVAGLSVDIDDFKRVNDEYGHTAGDHLLVEISRRLTRSLRMFDTVTRMGGDEFFVLFREVDSVSQAEAMATRILMNLREPIQMKEAVIEPTCSIGIAMATSGDLSPETLISRSDQAMYAAKKLGKNRYVIADGQ